MQEMIMNCGDVLIDPRTIGWCEWLALPELGIDIINSNVDTGTRVSTLHAFHVEPFGRDPVQWIRFGILPGESITGDVLVCEAAVKDERMVTDQVGHSELRYVIETELRLGDQRWLTEVTLTTHENMKCGVLLGRAALENKFIVNPAESYMLGKIPSKH